MMNAIEMPDVQLQAMQKNARESIQAHSLHDGARRFIQMSADALEGWRGKHGGASPNNP